MQRISFSAMQGNRFAAPVKIQRPAVPFAATPQEPAQPAPVKFGHCGVEGLVGAVIAPIGSLGFTLASKVAPGFASARGWDNPNSPAREKWNRRFSVHVPLLLGAGLTAFGATYYNNEMLAIEPEMKEKGYKELYYSQDATKYQLQVQVSESALPALAEVARTQFPEDASLLSGLAEGSLNYYDFERLVDAAPTDVRDGIRNNPDSYTIQYSEGVLENYRNILTTMSDRVAANVTDADIRAGINSLPLSELDKQSLTELLELTLQTDEHAPFVETDGLEEFDQVFMTALQEKFPDRFSQAELAKIEASAHAIQEDFEAVEGREGSLRTWQLLVLGIGVGLTSSSIAKAEIDPKKFLNRFRKKPQTQEA